MLRSVFRAIKPSLKTDFNVSKVTWHGSTPSRCFHASLLNLKQIRSKNEKVHVGSNKYETEVESETTVDIDTISGKDTHLFPTEETPNLLFEGVPFKDLPIINVKATPNNTVFSLTESKGSIITSWSAGCEGFKNARKGTNIAAQQTAITFGTRCIERGYKTIKLRIQGIGPGRMPSLKGLSMAGINIVSITDDTRVPWKPLRARKKRRI